MISLDQATNLLYNSIEVSDLQEKSWQEINELKQQLTYAQAEIDVLRAVLEECRSSVKFDLIHYEKMTRAYGNIGPESEEKHAIAEVEAERLYALLEKIDEVRRE